MFLEVWAWRRPAIGAHGANARAPHSSPCAIVSFLMYKLCIFLHLFYTTRLILNFVLRYNNLKHLSGLFHTNSPVSFFKTFKDLVLPIIEDIGLLNPLEKILCWLLVLIKNLSIDRPIMMIGRLRFLFEITMIMSEIILFVWNFVENGENITEKYRGRNDVRRR